MSHQSANNMAAKAVKLQIKEVSAERAEKLRNKPWWTEYHTRLNDYVNNVIPGTQVVAVPDDETLLEGLFEQNIVIPDLEKDVVFADGQPGQCHANCFDLLKTKQIEQWVTGYALSEDGLWRNHSWGKDKEGRIVETTFERIAYLGVPEPNPEPFVAALQAVELLKQRNHVAEQIFQFKRV